MLLKVLGMVDTLSGLSLMVNLIPLMYLFSFVMFIKGLYSVIVSYNSVLFFSMSILDLFASILMIINLSGINLGVINFIVGLLLFFKGFSSLVKLL